MFSRSRCKHFVRRVMQLCCISFRVENKNLILKTNVNFAGRLRKNCLFSFFSLYIQTLCINSSATQNTMYMLTCVNYIITDPWMYKVTKHASVGRETIVACDDICNYCTFCRTFASRSVNASNIVCDAKNGFKRTSQLRTLFSTQNTRFLGSWLFPFQMLWLRPFQLRFRSLILNKS